MQFSFKQNELLSTDKETERTKQWLAFCHLLMNAKMF